MISTWTLDNTDKKVAIIIISMMLLTTILVSAMLIWSKNYLS